MNDLLLVALLIFLGVLFTTDVNAAKLDCEKHPIYCQIIKNRTDKKGRVRINKKYAMKLSNVIHNAARKYKIPHRIYVAILMRESRYSLKAKGCHSGIRQLKDREIQARLALCALESHPERCTKGIPVIMETRICSDFGMSQIYYKTARRYGFEIDRLTTDLKYSIEAGAKVLGDFRKRYAKREKDWWTRYNASSRVKRDIYKQLVERFL